MQVTADGISQLRLPYLSYQILHIHINKTCQSILPYLLSQSLLLITTGSEFDLSGLAAAPSHSTHRE